MTGSVESLLMQTSLVHKHPSDTIRALLAKVLDRAMYRHVSFQHRRLHRLVLQAYPDLLVG
jgi:hypothetical protein